MLALGPRSRGALVAGALAAFALAYATTPLVAHGASAPLDLATAPAVAPPAPTPFVAVLPRRDPFAGAPDPGASTRAAALVPPPPAGTIPSLPSPPTIPGALGPLPSSGGVTLFSPSAGAGLVVPDIGPMRDVPPGGAARVTAIVSGAHAYALVEERGGTRVVAAGDPVDGDRVAAIDAAGVHLARGTTLAVTRADGFPAPAGGLVAPLPHSPPRGSR